MKVRGTVRACVAGLAALSVIATASPASAAAVYYYDVVANLDGKWKAYSSYSWYDYNYSRLCVRTYNSVAGAESYAELRSINPSEYGIGKVWDRNPLDGKADCIPLSGTSLGREVTLDVVHYNAAGVLDSAGTDRFVVGR